MTTDNATPKTQDDANPAPKPCTDLTDTLRKIDSGPSHNEGATKPRQIPVDLVEEESMESFPASDPPAHIHSNTNRPEPRRPGAAQE